MRRYRIWRFPLDAYEKWITKKKKIEERIKTNTGKVVSIPLTEVLRFYGQQQRFEWDDNVLPYFLKQKRKRGGGMII